MGALCPLSRHFSSSSSSKRLALYNLTSMVDINARYHQVLLIVLGPKSCHPVVNTLIMHASKPWLMLLNKVSLFLPKSSTIQKRFGQTMVAKHTTKTTMDLTTLLPSPRLTNDHCWREEAPRSVYVSSWEPLPNRNLVRGSDGISSEKYRCFFVRAPPGLALSDWATDL